MKLKIATFLIAGVKITSVFSNKLRVCKIEWPWKGETTDQFYEPR